MALTAPEIAKMDEIAAKRNELNQLYGVQTEIIAAQAARTGGADVHTSIRFHEISVGTILATFDSDTNAVADNLLGQVLTYVNGQIASLESDLAALLA